MKPFISTTMNSWIFTLYSESQPNAMLFVLLLKLFPLFQSALLSHVTCPRIAGALCKCALTLVHRGVLQAHLAHALPWPWDQPGFLYWRQALGSR